MGLPSLTVVLSAATAAYIAHSVWTVASLFYPTPCPADARCISSFLHSEPPLQLKALVSTKSRGRKETDFTVIWSVDNFNVSKNLETTVNVSVPRSTRNNGSLYCMIWLGDPAGRLLTADVHSTTVSAITGLTTLARRQAQAYSLMGNNESKHADSSEGRVITHWRSQLKINVMTQSIDFAFNRVPADLSKFMRVTRKNEYLPMLYIDELSFRTRDLLAVNESSKMLPLTITYEPISIGKLRLFSSMQQAIGTLQQLGFSEKDTDEVKSLFADTNLYFLILTFSVSAVHLLFDCLAFRNDISFWKNRKDMVGVSSKTVIWRCVSTLIITIYLYDQETSLLVLIPSAIATLIEMWKVKKAFRITMAWTGSRPYFVLGTASEQEKRSQAYDSQAMRYLSYLMWPLVLAGAIYSLLFTPHKSWLSWCIQTLVNGIYAFGFLFMLPQLFLNYKLKSVAHLPWKAFMYKAFNTFIDDLFAFIIVMPTAHRLACFRDDLVFLLYLYQRWLYPIDKTRINEFGQSFEDNSCSQLTNSTKMDDTDTPDSKKTK